MSISAAIGSGLSGLESNQRALDVSARGIAAATLQAQAGGTDVTLSAQGRALSGGAAGSGEANLATDLTNSLLYKVGFDLSAKLVQAADATLGTLIDIRA